MQTILTKIEENERDFDETSYKKIIKCFKEKAYRKQANNFVIFKGFFTKFAKIVPKELSTFPQINNYANQLIFMQNGEFWGLYGVINPSYPHFHIKIS